eukprot:3532181-Prymnesium_polylepis.1
MLPCNCERRARSVRVRVRVRRAWAHAGDGDDDRLARGQRGALDRRFGSREAHRRVCCAYAAGRVVRLERCCAVCLDGHAGVTFLNPSTWEILGFRTGFYPP